MSPEIDPATLDKQVYFKKSNPSIAYPSFEELLKAHPEVSCDHPDYDPYYCMDEVEWKEWMRTGIKPQHAVIV